MPSIRVTSSATIALRKGSWFIGDSLRRIDLLGLVRDRGELSQSRDWSSGLDLVCSDLRILKAAVHGLANQMLVIFYCYQLGRHVPVHKLPPLWTTLFLPKIVSASSDSLF
jgi:hypothetical protein